VPWREEHTCTKAASAFGSAAQTLSYHSLILEVKLLPFTQVRSGNPQTFVLPTNGLVQSDQFPKPLRCKHKYG